MTRISLDATIDQILVVLNEGITGPGGDFACYLDGGADAGLAKLLAAISPEEASRTVGKNSIAAHVNHLNFSAAAFGGFIAGKDQPVQWSESWNVSTVDQAAWNQLQSDLKAAHAKLVEAITGFAVNSSPAFGASVAAAAHLAYHVGIIRQKLSIIRGHEAA